MAALANPAQLYVGSDKYNSVTAWPSATIPAAGNLVRQSAAPTLGSERVFVCVTETGATGVSEPTWVATKGAKTTDNLVTWQECTGQPAVNGDVTNTKDWNSAKSNTVALGQIIKNIAGTFYFICDTAGTAGSGAEPTWNTTAGQTTADNTVTWRSIGAVGNFGAFAAPHKRILNADAATWSTVVPSIMYISNAHAETQSSSLALAGGQGTVANPNQYLCVSNATAPPTACTTGASVATTGASTLTFTKFSYYYGIAFSSGSVANSANMIFNTNNQAADYFESCSFTLNTTSSTTQFQMGNAFGSSQVDNINGFLNCSFVFGAAGQSMLLQAAVINITGGSIALTGTAPTTLVKGTGNAPTQVTIRDCDLSGITGTLFTISTSAFGYFLLENCKLGAAVAMTTGSPPGPGCIQYKMHNCDSGSKNYRFFEGNYSATIQQETTIINNAGATDLTQRVSWNIATTTNAKFGAPYVSPEITAWNDTTGSSVTCTVEIAGANTLTNGDIWMEIEYLGSASFPIGSLANNRVADAITAVSNVTTSAASWGGSPAHTQKLQVTFTPQMKGPVKARIFVAKASITVYVDPLLTIA